MRSILPVHAVALICLLAAPLAHTSTAYRSQSRAEAEGAALVAVAAHRDVDGAFVQASKLARSSDEALRGRLDQQKRNVAAAAQGLGALRSVSTAEEMVFAGCVTHRYLVRYADGNQRWMLKYRRGTEGWYLADLHVASQR